MILIKKECLMTKKDILKATKKKYKPFVTAITNIPGYTWSISDEGSLYYHHKDLSITSGGKPHLSFRVSDHWNWVKDNGEVGCPLYALSEDVGSDPYNVTTFAIYIADSSMTGVYHELSLDNPDYVESVIKQIKKTINPEKNKKNIEMLNKKLTAKEKKQGLSKIKCSNNLCFYGGDKFIVGKDVILCENCYAGDK